MIKHTTTALLLVSVILQASCSTTESDGRKYASSSGSPVQGKMGVSYKRVRVPGAENSSTGSEPKTIESDGLLGAFTGDNDEPPGLLDRNEKPDEPGAVYWMHGQQSASPVQGKMGVRVVRKKK